MTPTTPRPAVTDDLDALDELEEAPDSYEVPDTRAGAPILRTVGAAAATLVGLCCAVADRHPRADRRLFAAVNHRHEPAALVVLQRTTPGWAEHFKARHAALHIVITF